MFRISLSRISGIAVVVLFLSAVGWAQVGQVEGTVRIKVADGTKKPVPDALVDIYRTDIKGHWEVKTDKNGHYVRLGLPLGGQFLFVLSGPGISPTYIAGRITQMPVVDFAADPGEGQKLTLEDVQKAIAGQKAGGGGQTGGARTAPVDKAKMEAAQKEQETKNKDAKELQENFDQARNHYNTGVDLMKATNYQNALSEFELASNVDPGKHAAMLLLSYRANANLAEAHYQIGVDLFNKRQRPEARTHFESALAASRKAIAGGSNDTAENNPSLNTDLIVYYNIFIKNAGLLVEHYSSVDLVDETLKLVDKVAALDAVNKNKWGVMKADILRWAIKSEEAVAAYKKVLADDPAYADALYGLGLTLIGSTERAQIQEGANTLAEFVAKAPPTDKRVPIVKDALEGVKNAYKVEAEKPATPARRKRP